MRQFYARVKVSSHIICVFSIGCVFCQRLTPGAVLFNFIDENIVFGKIEKQICVYQVIFNIYQYVILKTDAQNEQNAIVYRFWTF